MRVDRVPRPAPRSLYAGLAVLILAALTPAGQASATHKQAACWNRGNAIRVVVKNIRSDRGTITADLHGDDPEEFLKKGKKILRVRVPARSGQVELCLAAPSPGIFAIGLYHDENGNRKFDKNFLGLPAEPYGISNDPTLLLARPKHEDAAFTVGPEGANLVITLRH